MWAASSADKCQLIGVRRRSLRPQAATTSANFRPVAADQSHRIPAAYPPLPEGSNELIGTRVELREGSVSVLAHDGRGVGSLFRPPTQYHPLLRELAAAVFVLVRRGQVMRSPGRSGICKPRSKT